MRGFMNLRNKVVTVVGLGKSGFAAAKFLAERGCRVKVTDQSLKKEVLENADFLQAMGVTVETGGHTVTSLEGAKLVVKSPGVPSHALLFRVARHRRIPVTSEIELGSRFCRGPIIAVTGSNGKTTTSHLIHSILSHSGKSTVLCGNVGYAFLEALAGIKENTAVVLELSSFQLEDSPTFHPSVAVILNISPNHLDRHGTLRRYIRAKEKIFKNQTPRDFLVLNYDDRVVRRMAGKTRARSIFFSKQRLAHGVFMEEGKIIVNIAGRPRFELSTEKLQLRGGHNLENIMASVAVGAIMQVSARRMQEILDSFRTLEHRIEPVGRLGGVDFINDSKSTTIESTRAAVLSLNQPVVLVAGGRDKGADFTSIEPLFCRRVKKCVLYGEAAKKIASTWKLFKRHRSKTRFKEAVSLAYALSEPGDALLLSPMCTSFDQFSSFEERGAAFKKIFQELNSKR